MTPASDGRQASHERPVVVYIVGSGRSGSTLLERILGGTDRFVNVGEVNELFRRVGPLDERCGCGQPFSQCPFWTAVGERAFGGWSSVDFGEVASTQREVSRQRHLPQLLAYPRGSAAFTHQLERYHDMYARIYHAIRAEAGADVIVDASKGPALGLALARAADLDVRPLHLVRDARGVSYSWAKADVKRPQAADGDGVMSSYSAWYTAGWWATFQLEAEAMGQALPIAARIRYEDLVGNPRDAVARALSDLGLASYAGGLGHLDEKGVSLEPTHGLAGNPSRFRQGYINLALDEEWRTRMSDKDRRVATAIGWPGLVRYGYLTKRRR